MTDHASGGHVLAITDLGPASTNAVWRAALIAREHGAALQLLHACRDRRRLDSARQALDSITDKVQARLGIRLAAEIHEGDLLPHAVAAARAAGLLVIGPTRSNTLREWISGTQAERLIRLCRVPTLVVKRPAILGRNAPSDPSDELGRYRRVLVPVDLRDESVSQIASAMSFSRDPQTQIFHVLDPKHDSKPKSRPSLQPHNEVLMQAAHSKVRALIESSGATQLGAVPAIGFGHAAICVLQKERATGAELVVIGKRRRGLLADFVLGGVTQEVLARSQADVLVMPKERPAPI